VYDPCGLDCDIPWGYKNYLTPLDAEILGCIKYFL
jgi:hypothetical protein